MADLIDSIVDIDVEEKPFVRTSDGLSDAIIDSSAVRVGYTARESNSGRRVVDGTDRGRNKHSADYVNFRFCQPTYGHIPIPHSRRNRVAVRFEYWQEVVKTIFKMKIRNWQKKQLITKAIFAYQQELRLENIRYRDLWRKVNRYGF